MPRIITSVEQFEQLESKAQEVRVVRSDKAVKLKLRTPTYLYTYVSNSDEAEDLIKGLKDLKDVKVIEFGAEKKEEKGTSKKKEKSEDSE